MVYWFFRGKDEIALLAEIHIPLGAEFLPSQTAGDVALASHEMLGLFVDRICNRGRGTARQTPQRLTDRTPDSQNATTAAAAL